MALAKLFSPAKIGNMTVKNRVVFPAMGSGLPDEGGYVSQRLIDYHVARAKGGCGLIQVEIAAVHRSTQAPTILGIYDDEFLPGLTKLASAIKENGAKACIQLWHAGRQTNSAKTGHPLIAPYGIPCPLCQEQPKEMTKEDINEIVNGYGDGALRAKKAGFDCIELHGAHGYLIAQFMSPYSNHRTDEYGSSLENRARFALEVIKNCREKVGPDFPIIYRLSAEERVENGLTLEDTKKIVKLVEKAGVDAIHVSIGVFETLYYTVPPIDMPIAFNVDNAHEIKKIVDVPVIAVDRINDPLVAEQVLDDNKADFIAIGRGQLTDAEFCNKAEAGSYDKINKCIACNQGCVDRLFYFGLPISCLLNPACGNEREYEIKKADKKKKVLVIGGGPGGLETAITLKKRGHDVTLCEKTSRLGGNFYLAGIAPRKEEIGASAHRLGIRAKEIGVDVRLQTEVDESFIDQFKADVVILATGSTQLVPDIKGVDKGHVITADEVLKGQKTAKDRVAIVGGGLVGVEVAELLAEQKKDVHIIEREAEIAKDMGFLRKAIVMQYLAKDDTKIHTESECLEILDNSVVISKNGNNESIDNINSVVIAAGYSPVNNLKPHLESKKIEHYVVGDALNPRNALHAIWEGNEIARTI